MDLVTIVIAYMTFIGLKVAKIIKCSWAWCLIIMGTPPFILGIYFFNTLYWHGGGHSHISGIADMVFTLGGLLFTGIGGICYLAALLLFSKKKQMRQNKYKKKPMHQNKSKNKPMHQVDEESGSHCESEPLHSNSDLPN